MLFKKYIKESFNTKDVPEVEKKEPSVAESEPVEEKIPDVEAKVVESYDEDGYEERCETCGTLLNDMGTCPKCDHGETECCDNMEESLSAREKLKAAYPELNFDDKASDEIKEDLSVREKLKAAYPELNFDSESIEESYDDEYDDDYYALDDVELDRRHAALYGGDRMYCDCGRKLVMDEWGGHCPHCDPQEFED